MQCKFSNFQSQRRVIFRLCTVELYNLQFSLQSASPETFGYTHVLNGT